MDVAVSSYSPTLKALLKPSLCAELSDRDPKVLIVSHEDAAVPDQGPGTGEEMSVILSLFPQSKTALSCTEATVAAVLEGIKTHDWVHLACCGLQCDTDPTKNAFLLYDGSISLKSTHTPKAVYELSNGGESLAQLAEAMLGSADLVVSIFLHVYMHGSSWV